MASAKDLLLELEADPADTDMMDVDALLRACNYDCFDYGQFDTLLYRHTGWRSTLTFPRHCRTVPTRRLVGILEMLRANLMREGQL